MLSITKRDGSIVAFNINKIKLMISRACEGLEVNPLVLESKVSSLFIEGITTRSIQNNLIQNSVSLTSIEEPHWKDVAGRLMMMSHWKETRISRGYGYEDPYRAISEKIARGDYSERLSVYLPEELKEACSWVDPELDLNYDYAGMSVLVNPNPNKRYLMKDELLQEAYLAQSLMLASVEKEEDRLKWAKEFYYWLSRKKISLATPFWTNLRKPGGNIASCFIIALNDDTDSIFPGIHKVAKISKAGGGVGVNISRIRASGSWIRGKAKASNGVVPFVKIINDTAIAIDQGGARAGAVTISLDSWHLDLPEFLEMQTEHGDQRRKCYDIFPQVVCSNEFMRRVREGEKLWTLVDPYEVRTKYGVELATLWGEEFEKFYSRLESELEGNGSNPNLETKGLTLWKRVNARDLYKQIMKSQIETGLPYEAYKDTLNIYNPNKHDGYIPGLNLCVESTSNVAPDKYDHVCNLLSQVLSNLSLSEIPQCSRVAVRMLDNGIELTSPPTQHSADHNKRYRTIGIGYMGLHDHLAINDLNYHTGRDYAGSLAELIAFHSFKASIDLAKERGSFEAFPGSELNKGIVLGKLFKGNQYVLVSELRRYLAEDTIELAARYNSEKLEEVFEMAKELGIPIYSCDLDWDEIREGVQLGIRNSQLLAVAPNTTTSLIQGCTSSILPVFSRFFMDKTGKGTTVNCPPFLSKKFWFYTENKNTDQAIVIDVCTEMQKWIDTGISMELLFDLNKEEIDARYIFERKLKAWEQGAKAIYYIRSVDKQIDPDKECTSCSN